MVVVFLSSGLVPGQVFYSLRERRSPERPGPFQNRSRKKGSRGTMRPLRLVIKEETVDSCSPLTRCRRAGEGPD